MEEDKGWQWRSFGLPSSSLWLLLITLPSCHHPKTRLRRGRGKNYGDFNFSHCPFWGASSTASVSVSHASASRSSYSSSSNFPQQPWPSLRETVKKQAGSDEGCQCICLSHGGNSRRGTGQLSWRKCGSKLIWGRGLLRKGWGVEAQGEHPARLEWASPLTFPGWPRQPDLNVLRSGCGPWALKLDMSGVEYLIP